MASGSDSGNFIIRNDKQSISERKGRNEPSWSDESVIYIITIMTALSLRRRQLQLHCDLLLFPLRWNDMQNVGSSTRQSVTRGSKEKAVNRKCCNTVDVTKINWLTLTVGTAGDFHITKLVSHSHSRKRLYNDILLKQLSNFIVDMLFW